jgi:hypothetical protein
MYCAFAWQGGRLGKFGIACALISVVPWIWPWIMYTVIYEYVDQLKLN